MDSNGQDRFRKRDEDWRAGAVVYQVMVDRFAPAADLEAKARLYAPPRRLRRWDELPRRGRYLKEHGVWSHELEFWGGDLASLCARLDHARDLGATVLYLNPIFDALTNHKYDANDYLKVAPEYGDRGDLRRLSDACHGAGMRLVLDGVFNHTGRGHRWFTDAPAMYTRGAQHPGAYLGWANVPNLPELRWEDPAVRACICDGPGSVVRAYLREDGVDGWRLDVAYELGLEHLARIREAAHAEKPGALVLGEVWSYPDTWCTALDGVLNFTFRQAILHLLRRDTDGAQIGRLLRHVARDTGLDPLLRSWIILDNHDTPRINSVLRQPWQRRLARLLQFTLPGSPCVYYGSELGMEGGHDPEMRAPMRWDLVRKDNEELRWLRRLLRVRAELRALRVGDFEVLPARELLCFMRRTDRVDETVLVAVNASANAVSEVLPLPEARFVNDEQLHDVMGRSKVRVLAGTAHLKVPPRTARVFRARIHRGGPGHSPYKRIM